MAADFVQNRLATTPGFAMPYLLAALGLMINERAGVLNLGCEGMMLVGAMTAAVVSFHTGLAGAGVPAAMLAGALVALVFGIAVVVFRADQVLTGLIIVAFGDGLTGVVGRPYMFEKVAGFRNLDLGPLSDSVARPHPLSRTSWCMPPPRSPWPCGGASTAPMSAFVSAPWARTPQPPTLQA